MAALVVGAFCAFIFFVYYKLCDVYTYWEKRNIKGPTPELLFGNLRTMFMKKNSFTQEMARLYNEYPKEKAIGIYQGLTPLLLVRDIEINKKILVKDFPHFKYRGFSLTDDPLAKNLFALDGEEWKGLRQKMTPLFSISKLKNMMPLINSALKEYIQYLKKVVDKNVPQEVRDLNSKYTLKVIISVGFGLDIDTFEEKHELTRMTEELVKHGYLRRVAILVDSLIPGIIRKLKITFMPKKMSDFFMNLVSGIIEEREGKPKVRKDFMDLMIELKEQGSVSKESTKEEESTEYEITVDTIAAQALIFYSAGFETSSMSMSFMLYELALDQDIQERCYQEIKALMKKYNEELPYEAMSELEFVSMAYDETLRKHPVAGTLLRRCVSEYKIPELNLTLEKGTRIISSVCALHRDPQYYPDPDKFDPYRFSPDKKHNLPYMPFGDGPRACIGARLARLQSILGVVYFLYNYKVTPCDKTPRVMEYDPVVIILKSKHGLWLTMEPRTESC